METHEEMMRKLEDSIVNNDRSTFIRIYKNIEKYLINYHHLIDIAYIFNSVEIHKTLSIDQKKYMTSPELPLIMCIKTNDFESFDIIYKKERNNITEYFSILVESINVGHERSINIILIDIEIFMRDGKIISDINYHDLIKMAIRKKKIVIFDMIYNHINRINSFIRLAIPYIYMIMKY